jgi:excisionase family DNA binding protein
VLLRAERSADPTKPDYREFDCGHRVDDPPTDPLLQMRWMTVAEVADMMRVVPMTVYRMCHSGELRASRFGSSFRIAEQHLADYLREKMPAHDS